MNEFLPRTLLRLSILLPVLLLAACASVSTGPAPERMVEAIRRAAGSGDGELAVQPLRDPRVEDLRVRASQQESQRDYKGAARSLDAALAIVVDDPALLQERAEAALLLRDYAEADRLARRAYELGAQVGPLCRRHWATLEQLRLREGDAAAAAQARERIEACRVAGPDRF